VELPGKAAERAKKVRALQLEVGSFSDGAFPGRSFDAICLWHVFEHISHPRETLELISSRLAEGGFLFISLPNIESLEARIFRKNWFHLDPPRHLHFLPIKTLGKELAVRGFIPVKRNFFSLEYGPFGLFQSILNCLSSKRDALYTELREPMHRLGFLRMLHIGFALLILGPLAILLTIVSSISKSGSTMDLVFRKCSIRQPEL